MARVLNTDSPASCDGHSNTGTQRWLLPYADVLTLLFALFAYQYFLKTEHAGTFAPSTPSPAATSAPSESAAATTDSTAPVVVNGAARPFESQLHQALRGADARLFKVSSDERGVVLVLSDSPLLFSSASDNLSAAGKQLLRKLVPLFEDPRVHVHIEGHTDSQPLQGSPYGDNWGLSVARAGAVARALIAFEVGIDQLSMMGYGARRPVFSNENDLGRSKNRRVELVFRILSPEIPTP